MRIRSTGKRCNTSTLGIISDVYKINRRFDDAREILLLANEKSPQNRRIVYALCDLAIKTGQVVEAVEYYKQFVQLSPNDNSKYILLYKIYEAQDISLEERIAVLKEYKNANIMKSGHMSWHFCITGSDLPRSV